MLIARRSILSLVGVLALSPGLGKADQTTADPNSPYGLRAIGSPDAKVKAVEYFSLTCAHCAHFATVTMPLVKPRLIDTGELQLIFRDFPLDQVALMAAQVARSLPAAQYYPFVEALFASQNDWAFTPGIDYKEAIYKYAALAGMPRADYDAALADAKLRQFILNEQQEAEKMYNIDSTPSFIIGGKTYPGAMEYPDFSAVITKAAAA